MLIEKSDVIAVRMDDGRLVCTAHLGDDWGAVTSRDLFTRDDLERDDDSLYFCDECGAKLG
ncbi:MAG: hypothetical protein P1P84_05630 [Deferrisomatales bacterium]|nr:hypothetical protein [Deferrisomatales bacterium]